MARGFASVWCVELAEDAETWTLERLAPDNGLRSQRLRAASVARLAQARE